MIMDDKISFALTPADKISPTWQKLREHLETKLKNARGKNDDATLDEIQTAALRGQIQTLKSIISLGDTSPVIPD
jgi:hypothetical protein